MAAWWKDPRLAFQLNTDNFKFILNTQEINLRIDRRNCTMKGREEATLKKLEVRKCSLGEKQIMGATERREPLSQRKVREAGMHRDRHKEITSPKPLVGETKDADFMSFCKQQGSKDLEVHRLGWDRDLRVLPYSWREDM